MSTINDENDLRVVFTTGIINQSTNDYWIVVDNNIIEYDFKFPLISPKLEDYESTLTARIFGDFGIKMQNCIFNNTIILYKGIRNPKNIFFDNCTFNDRVSIHGFDTGVITFLNCTFNKLFDARNAIIDGKVRFRECHFKDDAIFRNTRFNELADFWRSIFYKKTIFFKTDFINTAVFSAATFKENVLFTYTLIDKLMILRGTKIEKGFDLSLAIIKGKLGLFEFNLDNYKDAEFFTDEDRYEEAVSELAVIPIKNKRETFRILKDNLESQKNLSESLKYKAIEKEIFRNELKEFQNISTLSWWEQIKNWCNNRFERINLWLNKWSNDHGNSYGRAFAFIIVVGWIFFYISLITTKTYSFIGIRRISEWEFSEGFKLFVEFLNPIHKFDYIENPKLSSAWFYFFDFLGKTFVGYGIYQFIQAFRKYK